MRSINRKKF